MLRALICGVGGQDGAYLAQFLLEKGYEVWGTSRDAQAASFSNLAKLGIVSRIHKISMAPNDFRSVLSAISQCNPDEIYNLSGQTSVGLSFEQPVEALESIATGTLNILEAIRFLGGAIRFYSAGSSECFGDVGSIPANENTRLQPCSPYAIAKSTSYWLVENYRVAYGIYAATGLLFNHESPLRPTHFVTQKIIKAVVRIAGGSEEKLILGNLDVQRDWGWAPEYVEAMWKMLQLSSAQDFVISTGQSHSLKEFVESAFLCLGLDWSKYVEIDSKLFRPNEIAFSCGDSLKAEVLLSWRATHKMKDVVSMMIKAELEDFKG